MRRLSPDVLSQRDRAVLADLDRLRLLTGRQVERLHFNTLSTAAARSSARRRSLGRLVSLELVTTLPRRVGGVRAGSAGLIYTLDARAFRERPLWDCSDAAVSGKARRPWAIGWQFVSHTLDVAELYVRLQEAERDDAKVHLLRFAAEPAAWFSDDLGTLKPDAYVVVEADDLERFSWVEVDRATESLPTLRRKLGQYLDRYEAGSPGPEGVLPRVLVTVPDERRRAAVAGLIGQLAASGYLAVTTYDRALDALVGTPPRPPP